MERMKSVEKFHGLGFLAQPGFQVSTGIVRILPSNL